MDRTAINDEIEKILRSRSFAGKGQLRKLLEILSRSMDSPNSLKPDQVIKELWPEETKTKGSADVASEVNRLRRALEFYYEDDGKSDSIMISLPNRSLPGPDGLPEKRWIVAQPRVAVIDNAGDAKSQRNIRVIGVVFVIAVTLGIATYVSFRVLAMPDQPKFGRLDGNALVIMDTNGKEIWRKVFPDGFGPDWYYAEWQPTRIWFGDLEGKGHTSVLFSYSAAGPLSHSSTLICYSDRGKEKWRWAPGKELPELAGSPGTFVTHVVRILNSMDTRPSRILVLSQHSPWWPTQLALLDSSGKTVSEYWHSGGLGLMTLADLDGDGREEIIATGVANGYDHQATLVVLDPDRLSGASTEVQPEFQIHGMGFAQERLRLLFPRSDLNRALFQFNKATEPTFEHGVLRVKTMECITPFPGSCAIWYEFDKNFRLIAAYGGSDEFRSAHNKFFQTGKNAHSLSDEEQAAFQKVRCLTGCSSEFVPVGKLVP